MQKNIDNFLLELDTSEQLERQLAGAAGRVAGKGKTRGRPRSRKAPKRRGAVKVKLTDDDVVLVRQLWAAGEPIASIAEKFEVSSATVYTILTRRRRGNVP